LENWKELARILGEIWATNDFKSGKAEFEKVEISKKEKKENETEDRAA